MSYEIDFRDLLTLGYYLVAIITVVFVIIDNKAPIKTLSWILVLLTLPIIGLILYFYLGHNFRKEKLFEGKKKLDIRRISEIVRVQSLDLHQHKEKLGEAFNKYRVINLLLRSNKSRLTRKNKIAVLNDGRETYNTLLGILNSAKHHIHLEYYIFEDGSIAEEIKRILISKSSQGVKVKFIFDAVGSWDLSDEYLDELVAYGIEVKPFMSVRFPQFTSKINYRNHRKIVVVDGEKGMLGGINISDKYIDLDPEIDMHWRDTHLLLEGESVNDLQLIFLTDWQFLNESDLMEFKEEEAYFPECKMEDICVTQILGSGPDTEYHAILNAYFSAITTAKDCVYVVTPYFIPTESMLKALCAVAGSGVQVKMMIPGISDSRMVQLASQSYFEELLEAGVQIFQYHGGFIHSKILIVDDILSSVGTANMDFRSFEQNLEVNAMIYDTAICRQLKETFYKDLKNCREIKLDSWKKRRKRVKWGESFSRIFAPLY